MRIETLARIKRAKYTKPLVIYTLVFFAMLPLVLANFIIEGQSLIWRLDGLPLHGTNLLLAGEWIRSTFAGILHGTAPSLVNMQLGLGVDIPSAYGVWIADPFNFIGALIVTEDNLEIVYASIIITRLYFTGLSFLIFGLYKKLNWKGALFGAVLYAFSYYSLFLGMRHPYFVSAMVFLPLLLLGVERAIQRQDRFLLVGVVALSAASSYYFLYMNLVFCCLWALLNYKTLANKPGIFDFLQVLFSSIAKILLGLGLAAIPVLTRVLPLLESARTTSYLATPSLWSYGDQHIATLLYHYTIPSHNVGFWIELGFPAIAILCIAAMIGSDSRRERLPLIVLFTGLTIALALPAFGLLMNGFSSVSNRWVFQYAFVVNWIVAIYSPSLNDLNRRQSTIALIMSALLICILLVFGFGRKSLEVVGLAFLIGNIIIIAIRNNIKIEKLPYMIGVFGLLNLCLISYFTFSARGLNYGEEFVQRNRFWDELSFYSGRLVTQINDYSGERVSIAERSISGANYAAIAGYRGVTSSFGVRPQGEIDYARDIENVGQYNVNFLSDLDNRAQLMDQVGVKYHLRPHGSNEPIPAGYLYRETLNDGVLAADLFVNPSPMPIALFYENVVLESFAEEVSAIDRQELYLEAAVISDETARVQQIPVLDEVDFQMSKHLRSIRPDNFIEYGIERVDKSTFVSNNGSFTVPAPRNDGGPLYLRFDSMTIAEPWKSPVYIKISVGNNVTSFHVIPDENQYSFGQKNHLVYLGELVSRGTPIAIEVDQGRFTLENIEIYEGERERSYLQNQNLSANIMSISEPSRHQIAVDIQAEKDGVLVISTPFSSGWRVSVDGVEASAIKVNSMFLGVPISKGDSAVEFTYLPPGASSGLIIMGSSLGILIISASASRRVNVKYE